MKPIKFTGVIKALEEWKFNDAWSILGEIDRDANGVEGIIGALATSYGNCRWFRGHQGEIVSTTVSFVVAELRRLDDDHDGV
jgi:hypothetical protein